MTYAELEYKFGKRNMDKCTELYRKYVVEAMAKGTKAVLVGLDTYLSRVNPILGGGVNTKELLEDLKGYGFWDQVVILSWYSGRMKKVKRKNNDE
jgi:hypothetical protein